MARLLSAWRGMRRFRALPRRDRAIVFYAEDGASWVHFEPVIRALATTHGRGVCYLTSSPRDPVLEREDEAVRAFYIGDGVCRTFLLRILEAGVVVMTMPDLETFHIKRSKYPVHYIYLHHSIVSTHMIYRRGAFDGFDTVFCVTTWLRSERPRRFTVSSRSSWSRTATDGSTRSSRRRRRRRHRRRGRGGGS